MKFTISKEDFLEGLQQVQHVVSNRTTLPILSNVLLEAEDGSLRLTTTDLDVGVTGSVKAKVGKSGSTTLPARRLAGIVRELPADERTFVPAKTEISADPLGLKIDNLSEENSQPNDPENGVLVLRVNNGSPAYGKLTRGDIITEVISQGKRYAIENAESFRELIDQFEEGDKLAIVGRRNNNRFFVAVTVD